MYYIASMYVDYSLFFCYYIYSISLNMLLDVLLLLLTKAAIAVVVAVKYAIYEKL